MLKLLLLLNLSIVSFGSATLAQQQLPTEKVLPIRGFAGLNNNNGLFLLKPNEATIAINLDMGLNLGSTTKRFGIEAIDTLHGIDSILGIGVANISDGSQYLAIVTDDSAANYGSVRIGRKNSSSLDSFQTIFNRFPVSGKPTFSLFRDELYITNENNRAIHYKNGRAFFYPPLSPGEPYILPLARVGADTGKVDGTVRYVFTRKKSGILLPDVGYVSQPVRVRNQSVRLSGFPIQASDSFISTSTNDSIEIWRTRGTVQPLDRYDSVWSTGLYAVITPSSDKFAVTVTDTMSEAYLTLGIPMLVSNNNLPAGGTSITSPSVRAARWGAPGWVESDSAGYNHYSSDGFGIWRSATRVIGWKWNASLYDTIRNIESDTGPGLVWLTKATVGAGTIYFDSLRGVSRANAAIPKIVMPASADSVSQIRLYRSPILVATLDTIATINSKVWGWSFNRRGELVEGWFNWSSYKLGSDSTFFGTPRLVGQYSKFDTITDTLRYDSLLLRSPYLPEIASGFTGYQRGLITFGGRFWSFAGNRVFFTSLDSAYRFGALNSISVDDGDGDIIVALVPSSDGLLVFKTKATYLIYQGSDGSFGRSKITSNIGCVAPRSIAKSSRGIYFLSDAGVIRQTPGQYREANPNLELISGNLPQLGRFTSARKYGAVGTCYDDKYILAFGDTTYIYSELAGGWSTWEFGMQDIASYAVEDAQSFLPLDSLYFLMSAEGQTGTGSVGRVLWRYGPGELDSGYQSDFAISNGPPSWIWRSVPILSGSGYKSITKIGFYGSGGSSDQFEVKLYDETGTEVSSKTVTGIDGKYVEVGFPPTTAKFYQIQIASSGIVSTGRTVIDGMDVYYTENGNIDIK